MKFYIISPLTPCGDIVHLITAPSGQCCGGLAVTMKMVQNPPGGLQHPRGAPSAVPMSQGGRAKHWLAQALRCTGGHHKLQVPARFSITRRFLG